MQRTKIPWATHSWNPISGCSPASEGCQNCYAATMAHRFHRPWGKPVFHPETIDEPRRLRKPARIFVCSTSDLFHESAEVAWLNAIFAEMMVASMDRGHTFMVLTKRPARMAWYLGQTHFWRREAATGWPGIWLGVTAENQARADERLPVLLSIPAAVRFVSAEPMLTPVDLSRYLPQPCAIGAVPGCGDCDPCVQNAVAPALSWVIAGPETGRKARGFDSAWIDGRPGVLEQCRRAGVPFFDKRDGVGRVRELPEGGAR